MELRVILEDSSIEQSSYRTEQQDWKIKPLYSEWKAIGEERLIQNEAILSERIDSIRKINLRFLGIPEDEEKEREVDIIFKVVIEEDFPYLVNAENISTEKAEKNTHERGEQWHTGLGTRYHAQGAQFETMLLTCRGKQFKIIEVGLQVGVHFPLPLSISLCTIK